MADLLKNKYEITIKSKFGELVTEGIGKDENEVKQAIMRRFSLYEVEVLKVIFKREVYAI